MKTDQNGSDKKEEQKEKKRGSRFYLFLRIFRTLFLTSVLLLLLLQPIVNSPYVGKKIKETLNSKFDNAFHWDSYHLSLLNRELSVNGFALTEDDDTLASADRVAVRIRPLAFLGNTLKITKAELVNPYVTYHVDSSGLSGYQRIFVGDPKEKEEKEPLKFIIRGIKIEGATISYEDLRSDMRASLTDMQLEAYYNSEFFDCDIDLSLRNLHYSDKVRRFDFDTLDCFLEMVGSNINETEIYLRNDSTELALEGELRAPFAIQEATGSFTVKSTMPMGILQNIIGDTTIGSGVITLSATHEGSINRPDVKINATYKGRDFFYSPLNSIDLSVELKNMKAKIDKSSASFSSGEKFTVEGSATLGEIFPKGFLNGYVHEGLHGMKWSAEAHAEHYPAKKSGYDFYSVDAKGSGTGVLPEKMRSQLTLNGESSVTINEGKSKLSLNGGVDFTKNLLHIKEASLFEMGRKVIDFRGDFNLAKMTIDMSGDIDSLNLETLGPSYLNLPIAGSLASTIKAKGALLTPELDITLKGQNVAYDSMALGTIVSQIKFSGKEGRLFCDLTQVKDENRLMLLASANLFEKESFKPLKDPFVDLKFDLHMDLESMVKEGLAGIVKATGSYKGSLQRGSGTVSLLSDSIVTPYISLEQMHLKSKITPKEIEIEKGRFAFPQAGELAIAGTFDRKLKGELTLNTDKIVLDSIPYLADLKLSGLVKLDATARGDLAKPIVTAQSRIDSFAYDTYDLLTPLVCSLRYVGDSVTLRAGYEQGVLSADYNIKEGSYSAKGSFTDFSLDELFSYLKLDRLNGEVTTSFSVAGKGAEVQKGDVTIGSIELFDELKRVLTADSVVLSYKNGVAFIDTMSIQFDDTSSLNIAGTVGKSGDLAIVTRGDLPLQKLSSFVPEIVQARGGASINLTLGGTISDVEPSGSIYLNDLGCTILSTDQRIKRLHGNITFSSGGEIKPVLEAEVDESGYLLVNGSATLDSLALNNADIDISLYKLPIVVPDMADIVLGGELNYAVNKGKTSRLSGTLELIEGYYYQDIKLIPDLTARKRKAMAKADSTKPFIDLDVKLLPKGNLVVDNNLAYLEIVPDLQIKGSEKTTILEGRAEVQNGEISYLNTKFEVDQGQIDFVNPERIQMDVNIIAKANIRNYKLTLTLTGDPESNLDFHLTGIDSTETAVNDEDVLSLALTGYTMEELSVTGDEALKKLLSALVNSQIEDSKFKMIDRVSYEYLGENGNKFTFGEDLTRRLSTDVILEFNDTTTIQKAQFKFKVQDNVAIKSFVDTKGNSGGEVGFEFEKR